MKITKKQLQQLILLEISQDLNISDVELAAAREKLEAEGGAAGPGMVIAALKDADNTDAEAEKSISDDDILDALMKKDPDIAQHKQGDLVYKKGLNEIFGLFKRRKEEKEKAKRDELRKAKFKALQDLSQKLKTGEINRQQHDQMKQEIESGLDFKTSQQKLDAMTIGAEKSRRELENISKDAEKLRKMDALRKQVAINRKKRSDLNEILGLPSGQFDIKSIGRSGGPEMRSEEEYIKKAKAASVDLRKYEPLIEAAAYTHNVQYDLLYGILIDEHIRMYPRAIFDVLGYIGLMDTSVGVSQMRGSRAKQLSADGYYVPEGYTAEDIESMSIGKLQRIIADSPKVAINYAAGYINYIIDNWQLGDKNEFFNQLEKNTRVATIYSLGRADEFEGRTPDPVTGYEGVKPPGPSTRGSRAATVPGALRGDSDLADIITENEIRKIILEKLEKIGFYKKYSYGLDDIPDKTKAHDAIIGHT